MSELEIVKHVIELLDGNNTLVEWLNVIIPLFGYVLAIAGAFAFRGLIKELKQVIVTYRDTKLEESDKGRKTSKNEMKRVAMEGFDVLEELFEKHKTFSRLLRRWWDSLKGIFT